MDNKLKYTDNNVELRNQDCYEFLNGIKDNSVDLFFIDPPYTISKKTGFKSVKTGVRRFAVETEFGEWDKTIIDLDRLCNLAYKKLRKGGTFICFYDLWKITTLKYHMETNKFKGVRFIEWIKANPVPLNSSRNYLSNSREIALLGVKVGSKTFNTKYHNGIYTYPIEHGKHRFHPTQKPIKLITELILDNSKEGDLVLDCFSGSGTTMEACLNNNRKFVGCELDKEYYMKSIERISCEKENKK